MKFKPGRCRPGASLKVMKSMLSRDGRRDVIKMAVVIGDAGSTRGSTGTGRRRSSATSHRGSVSHLSSHLSPGRH